MRKIFYILIFSFLILNANGQNSKIQGSVIDSNTKETLVGCAVAIQGSSLGTTTNFDGVFNLINVAPGTYNLVLSYIGYKQQIINATVEKNQPTILAIELIPSDVVLEDVKIVANKRTNTELSMISSIKASNLVSSGISSQQILKSQDKDASEVIKRIPGINIRDGRFVIVRGLSERYNTVWLNGTPAPSSESDIRAFSFDVIPSNQLENIMIYKSPAPELPADFAGGAIKITTKNTAYDDKISISYGLGLQEGTSFNKVYKYEGGKTDWLGFDDGTRALPSGTPATAKEMRRWHDTSNKTPDEITADRQKATDLAQSFNKIWSPITKTALPDQSFSFELAKHFLIGNATVATVNAITYRNMNDAYTISRAGYQTYYTKPDTLYSYTDNQYSNEVRVGLLSNWSVIFGNNQKIQFRNLLNQSGISQTTLRNGIEKLANSLENSYELAYESRTTYLGQLAGEHMLSNEKTKFDWVLGYAFANKHEPDIRRVYYSKPADDAAASYSLLIPNVVNPSYLGRINLSNDEDIYSAGANLVQPVEIGDFKFDIKTGFYSEFKNRVFSARNIGFIQATNQFNYSLQSKPVDSVFLDENINYTDGITVSESTNLSDSYDASNILYAGYLAINIPLWEKLNIYGGIRIEQNAQTLNGYDITNDTVQIINDTLNIFPSINLSYNFTKSLILRAAYGKTVNRPEFRELAPYAFYDFEEKALIYGNQFLKNCYINNYDLRLEWYPNDGDMISVAAFYKDFSSPIEAGLESSGSGWNYRFDNADNAASKGLELDLRKTLTFFGSETAFTSFLNNLSIVFNASLIKSKLYTSKAIARDSVRSMQGQAPYIVNAGLFYSNPKGLMISVLYNVVGHHIVFVGSQEYAHIYKMPKHQLDLTLTKEFNEKLRIKAGIQNLLNDDEVRQNIKGDNEVGEDQITKKYSPGRSINIGVTFTF